MYKSAMTFALKPGCYDEYKRAHDELWTEIADALREKLYAPSAQAYVLYMVIRMSQHHIPLSFPYFTFFKHIFY